MSNIEYAPALKQVVDPWEELVRRGENDFVSVNLEVLDQIAAQNPELSMPDWRIPGMHPDNSWAFATQVVLSSVINFHFLNRNRTVGEGWSMIDPTTGGVLVASNALHPRIYQRFGEAEDITSQEIFSLIEKNAFSKFLPGVPMEQSRRSLLEDFAVNLDINYGGRVRNLLESARDTDGNLRLVNEGRGLVDRLTSTAEFGHSFFDTSHLDDLVFPFNKRANLVGVLVADRFNSDTTVPTIVDIDQSGAVPDYRIPQALRAKNVLEYKPKLAELVDTWTPIMKNSAEEIQIRGATAFATARLLHQVNEIRADADQEAYNMAHIDFWLWKMGRELKGTSSMPHFTETTAY